MKNGSICSYLEPGYPGLHKGGKVDDAPCPYLEWHSLYQVHDWIEGLKDKAMAEKLRDADSSEKTWPPLDIDLLKFMGWKQKV